MKRKIIAVICIAVGLAVMSVPLYYFLYGRDRTKRLMEEIEQTIMEESSNEGGGQRMVKGKPALMKRRLPHFRRGRNQRGGLALL